MENTSAPLSDNSLPGDRVVNVDALTRRRLDELGRMFDAGMERLTPLPSVLTADPCRAASAYGRITTALRQITILERELLGLRKAPRRDGLPIRSAAERTLRDDPMRLMRLSSADLDGRSGYSNGPLDQVVAGVRKVLGLPTPADDPFSPDAEAKAAERKPAPRPTTAAKPAVKTGNKPSQTEIALKAVRLALRANPRKGGFRLTKKVRKPAPTRRVVERHGQGPPG